MKDTFTPPSELWLMPAGIAGCDMRSFATAQHLEVLNKAAIWVVEEARTARRMIASVIQGFDFDSRQWYELPKSHKGQASDPWEQAMKEAPQGSVWALMSEAGMPAVADPGAEVVSLAHRLGWSVKVLSGPSSMMMALAASGFNGQQFAFHGYLPVESRPLQQKIQELEQGALRGATQLFIETPYRTDRMLQALLQTLRPGTWLAVMAGLDGPEAFCAVKTAADWVKNPPSVGKLPAVFLIGMPK
jgi:16S rRNA (cytidine1402-2'-O)-methyltransferase